MTKTLKKEYQPGGSKRQYILDKAVDYLLQPGLQADKHAFCVLTGSSIGVSRHSALGCNRTNSR